MSTEDWEDPGKVTDEGSASWVDYVLLALFFGMGLIAVVSLIP